MMLVIQVTSNLQLTTSHHDGQQVTTGSLNITENESVTSFCLDVYDVTTTNGNDEEDNVLNNGRGT